MMEIQHLEVQAAGPKAATPYRLAAPPLPREHGSWFMLLVPCAAGLVAAGQVSLPGVLFMFAATAFFLARQPLLLLFRKGRESAQTRRSWQFWLGTWSGVTGLSMAALILRYARTPLLPLSLVGLALLLYEVWRWRRSPRPDLRTELLAAVGMASSAPGAYVAEVGVWTQQAAVIWALSAFYFTAAVFYVNLMLVWRKQDPHSQGDRWRLGGSTLWAHVTAVAGGLALTLVGWAPPLAPLAYLPALAKAVQQISFGGRETSFKWLGLMEAAHSLVFLALLAVAYR